MTQIWETWLMDSLYIVCDLGQLFPKKKKKREHSQLSLTLGLL